MPQPYLTPAKSPIAPTFALFTSYPSHQNSHYTFTQLHALHHNACRHAAPERFDPSRVLTSADGSWAGFSLGRLACTGRGFAELQIAVALKALLTRYRLYSASIDAHAHNDYRGSVTLQPDPFSITFSVR